MPSERKSVLIGDANRKRFELLRKIFLTEFAVAAENVTTFLQVANQVLRSDAKHILIAEDLPYSDCKEPCPLRAI